MQAFAHCMDMEKVKTLIERDMMDAAQLGVAETPTFFINGWEISGNQPLKAFEAIIQEELQTAGRNEPELRTHLSAARPLLPST